VALSDRAYGHNAPALTVTALLAAHHRHTQSSDSGGGGARGRAACVAWDAVPARPPARPRCAARVVHLVSSVAGRLACPPRHVHDTVRTRMRVCASLPGPHTACLSGCLTFAIAAAAVCLVVDVVGSGAAAGVAAAVVVQVRR